MKRLLIFLVNWIMVLSIPIWILPAFLIISFVELSSFEKEWMSGKRFLFFN